MEAADPPPRRRPSLFGSLRFSTMFKRRSSLFCASIRSSMIIVDETRGAPLKIIPFLISILWFIRGVQFYFFCGHPFPGIEADRIAFDNWGGVDVCKDPFHKALSGLVGVHFLIVAAIRFNIATTEHVADLYHDMLLIVFVDILYCGLIIRTWDAFSENPIVLTISVPFGCVHEMYVLYKARNAHIKRQEMKELKKS
mmetsp:Transcript_21218/g.25252  ORF Transcript_21218/g.25252 Transcript_21218/m.25252 type:complete len:197 (+) Transcript_21218:120-710(+)